MSIYPSVEREREEHFRFFEVIERSTFQQEAAAASIEILTLSSTLFSIRALWQGETHKKRIEQYASSRDGWVDRFFLYILLYSNAFFIAFQLTIRFLMLFALECYIIIHRYSHVICNKCVTVLL